MTEQAAILNALKSEWPKPLSITRMIAITGLPIRFIENGTKALMCAGRINAIPQSYFCGYVLTRDEAEAQGIDLREPVRSSTEPVYSRPTYKPPSMAPARHDAQQAMQVMSRRGESLVPFALPIHMGSNIAGGMR